MQRFTSECQGKSSKKNLHCIILFKIANILIFYFAQCSQTSAPWIQHVINHLYWSVQTCHQNSEELQERFFSIIHHITNKHTFAGNKFYKKCKHDKYSREEADERCWLVMGSPAHNTLNSVIMLPQLIKDITKLNENIITTYLEVFHSLKIRYYRYSIFYEQEKMISGVQLAALDHNHNIDRPQVNKNIKEGIPIPRFKISYSKPSKRFVAKKVKTEKSYHYLRDIASDNYYRSQSTNEEDRARRK